MDVTFINPIVWDLFNQVSDFEFGALDQEGNHVLKTQQFFLRNDFLIQKSIFAFLEREN